MQNSTEEIPYISLTEFIEKATKPKDIPETKLTSTEWAEKWGGTVIVHTAIDSRSRLWQVYVKIVEFGVSIADKQGNNYTLYLSKEANIEYLKFVKKNRKWLRDDPIEQDRKLS